MYFTYLFAQYIFFKRKGKVSSNSRVFFLNNRLFRQVIIIFMLKFDEGSKSLQYKLQEQICQAKLFIQKINSRSN